MSDIKKIKGNRITKAYPNYEHIVVTHKDGDFFLSSEDLTKMVSHFDFTIEKKRTRTWGSPILKKGGVFINNESSVPNNLHNSSDSN